MHACDNTVNSFLYKRKLMHIECLLILSSTKNYFFIKTYYGKTNLHLFSSNQITLCEENCYSKYSAKYFICLVKNRGSHFIQWSFQEALMQEQYHSSTFDVFCHIFVWSMLIWLSAHITICQLQFHLSASKIDAVNFGAFMVRKSSKVRNFYFM